MPDMAEFEPRLDDKKNIVVVVDTSKIFNDHFLTRAPTLSLLSLGLLPNVSVVVPEATLTEHAKHAQQEAREHVANMRKFLRFRDIRRDPQRLMGLSVFVDATISDVYYGSGQPEHVISGVQYWHDSAVHSAQRAFDFAIGKAGAADLDEIVNLVSNGHKPFNEKGGGFADYVIWQTGLEFAARIDADAVILATANTSDFASSRRPNAVWSLVHPDLVHRLTSERRDAAFVCTDINALLRKLSGFDPEHWNNRTLFQALRSRPELWTGWLEKIESARAKWQPLPCASTAISYSGAVDGTLMIDRFNVDLPAHPDDEHPYPLSAESWTVFTAGDGRIGVMCLISGTATLIGESFVTSDVGQDREVVVPTWFANSVDGTYEQRTVELQGNVSIATVSFFEADSLRCTDVRIVNFYDEPTALPLGLS
nr:hypothetical protein GCM10020063_055510 [Dactylosporangium thailandense]